MRVPISIKLIFLVVSFLIGTTAYFAIESSTQFEAELVLREERENSQLALAKLREVENTLSALQQRMLSLGTLLAKKAYDKSRIENKETDEFWINFNNDRAIYSLEILQISKSGVQSVARKIKESQLRQLGHPVTYFDRLRSLRPLSLTGLHDQKLSVQNSAVKDGLPLMTVTTPLFVDDNQLVTHLVVADLELSVLQKSFSEPSEKTYFLTDQSGAVLAHTDEQTALSQQDFSQHPLIQRAMLQGASPNLQVQFQDPESLVPSIGAYAKSSYGLTVVSQIDRAKILEPAAKIKKDAVKIAGQVIAIAFFLSFLFALSLTSPIETLAALIQHVSRGNFDVKARSKVRSKDEVGDLAIAFDQMTDGLKERDKVKNLFNKFHGSSVAEEMLKKDISVGGTNREVTVFFSDIRGFTSFSEKRSPEEVVEMLNEYFTVMVAIINRYQGVVDKFIGDAIMAVWGAPKGTDRDPQNAVTACIEMRKALVELNEKRRERGQTPILIGMGLHHGPAISGTIGSQERMEYTVIGDTVNLTSRIEASTKAFGTDLLISKTVAEKVKDEFKLEYAGSAEAKGKSEPVELFKVLAIKNSDGIFEDVQTEFSVYKAEKDEKIKVA